MKYDGYAKLIWRLFARNCFTSLQQSDIQADRSFKQASQYEYKRMILETPSIGTVKTNPMILILLFSCLIFSIYKSSKTPLTAVQVQEMLKAIERNPIMVLFSKKSVFTEKWQLKRRALAKQSMENKHKYDWQTEFMQGKDVSEFSLRFFSCGICQLAKREEVFEVAPELCKFDYWMAEQMQAKLTRKKTIATGSAMCEFHYQKLE